jgi:hypothetical protein
VLTALDLESALDLLDPPDLPTGIDHRAW